VAGDMVESSCAWKSRISDSLGGRNDTEGMGRYRFRGSANLKRPALANALSDRFLGYLRVSHCLT
jgi:hypothetical protein